MCTKYIIRFQENIGRIFFRPGRTFFSTLHGDKKSNFQFKKKMRILSLSIEFLNRYKEKFDKNYYLVMKKWRGNFFVRKTHFLNFEA